MDAELTQLISQDKMLVIDIKDVDFLSSAGVRAIVNALKSAKKARGEVKLAALPDHTAEILHTVGIMEIVQTYPTVEEAVASF
jgi:anti-anti-sigma factor